MGQTASKVAKTVVSKSRASPATSVGAVGTAAKQTSDVQGPAEAPPQQQPVSEEVAASYPSPPDQRDVMQRRFLEEKAGSSEYQEMPPDLVDFLKAAGPLKQQPKASGSDNNDDVDTTAKQSAEMGTQERKLRLPRHLREQSSEEETTHSLPDSQPTSTKEAGAERQVESMRLAEKIPGFEISRTTNFSTTPAADDNDDPSIFKAGEVLDMYDMIMLNRQRGNEEAAVEEIYREYAQRHVLPEEDSEQEKQKDLLRKTLSYLEVPVIMMDTDGSYDGVRPEQVNDFEFMGGVVMPKTKVKNVLEDFSDMRKQEESSN